MLGITAAGLLAFGLYGIAEAAYRRITPPIYDEPGILSYAISSFCPTSADGLRKYDLKRGKRPERPPLGITP
jgi:hypothetical protein